MSVNSQTSPRESGIRPFTVEISETELQDLRHRIGETRWPHKELVDDRSQGMQSATIHPAH